MEKLRDKSDPFLDFVGRNQDLRALTRYSLYPVMLYRTNLYTHSHRTAALVRAINPVASSVFGASYDPRKAEIIALAHDDAELVFGDIQAGNKSKMTAEQLARVREAEERAIDEIAARFPAEVAGYAYKDLLREAADYSSLEAQVVCYADKYDALGEALHEVHAGNHHFTTNVVNEYGRIPTPPEYYADYFAKFPEKFPGMTPMLADAHPLFERVIARDYSTVVARSVPHIESTLHTPTGNPYYDTWRQIVLGDTNEEVVRDLHVQKEFLG